MRLDAPVPHYRGAFSNIERGQSVERRSPVVVLVSLPVINIGRVQSLKGQRPRILRRVSGPKAGLERVPVPECLCQPFALTWTFGTVSLSQ